MHHFKRTLRAAVATTILTATMLTAAFATGTGVTTDALRLRAQASTGSAILATAPKGASVDILNDNGNGWYQVSYNGKTGYMSAKYLTVTESAAADTTATATAAAAAEDVKYYVRATEAVNIRAGAGTEFDRLGTLYAGALADLVDESTAGWYKISYNGLEGYVSADYSVITDSSSVTLGQEIAAYALQFKGCRYVYGTAGPTTFDCSGLTSYVYAHFGYSLNRIANDQWFNGTAVSKSELQPGDLVLFNSGGARYATHVGIYIGDGQFIHASTSRTGVIVSDLNSNYYTKVYVGARRIV